MPIYRLLHQSAFAPEEVQILVAAYDEIILSLEFPTVPQIIAEAVARKVIAIGQSGERDRQRIVARVRSELGLLE